LRGGGTPKPLKFAQKCENAKKKAYFWAGVLETNLSRQLIIKTTAS
jgi:uncharacterized protein involved in tolerance to divalent cations